MKNSSFQRLWQILHRVVATRGLICDRVVKLRSCVSQMGAKTLLRGLAPRGNKTTFLQKHLELSDILFIFANESVIRYGKSKTIIDMKRLVYLFFCIVSLTANAQETQSVVTLKNGTELRGVIKSIDPKESIIIVISGIETTIKMEDVARVGSENSEPTIGTNNNISYDKELEDSKRITITDFADYPETFDLKIGDEILKMRLVRGADYVMGYDGRHSWSMKSEPVHKIGITSFYISETFVTSAIVSALKGKKKKKGYCIVWWKHANDIATLIAEKTNLALRLPTEAEWEYAACSKEQDIIFGTCKNFDFCSDWFGDFENAEYKIDPIGPSKGHNHVIRAYDRPRGKFDRAFVDISSYYFRLVIKAKDVIK